MTKIERSFLVDTYERELALRKRAEEIKKGIPYDGDIYREMFVNDAELFCKFSQEDTALGHAICGIMRQMADANLSVSRFVKVCEVCGMEVVETLEEKGNEIIF